MIINKLNLLRNHGGVIQTHGISDDLIERFAKTQPDLVTAVDRALVEFRELQDEYPDLLLMDESEQVSHVQERYINFYALDTIVPYLTLAAQGGWIVTLKGAVVYDCGGYGMIGFGHAPEFILKAMNAPHVMANMMTPSVSQKRFTDALRAEIGHTRGECPFERFVCLNSGSEAVTLAARLSDVNARIMTDPGGEHAHHTIRKLGLCSAFHGRTDRPAQFSDSTRKAYCQHLATFRDSDNLITVEPNDCQQLEQVFAFAESNNVFIEAFFMEPVMGEGNPGQSIDPAFYKLARKLTKAHGSLLLVDSIQAGLRAHGVLSIIDYPGFEGLEAPDMESYSKALNAGQYPLSVLAMTGRAADLYRTGIYGNTMTTNPRALDVATAVLKEVTPALRANIVARGQEFVDQFTALQTELGGRITKVQGTGLLFSLELDGSRYKGFGAGSTEEYMRTHGINVIHGGANSLRYTPPFGIGSVEVKMIVEATRQALLRGPVKVAESEAA
jgi:acetylornithine/succinyldiaminopimelate/putrescine aminotransferase